MKRTHYTVKAQRARKAWKRLKKQTRSKVNTPVQTSDNSLYDHSFTELV